MGILKSSGIRNRHWIENKIHLEEQLNYLFSAVVHAWGAVKGRQDTEEEMKGERQRYSGKETEKDKIER